MKAKRTITLFICLALISCVIPATFNIDANAAQSAYMFCRWCGKSIPSDSIYCKHCGRYVAESMESSPSQSPYAVIPRNPSSPYGRALRENLIDGVYYSDVQKVNTVTDTFYGRKDSSGNRKSWYYSTHRDDIYPGYRVELYYADGVLFFANVTKNSKNQVTLHYWGDEIVACRDLRGYNNEISYAGSSVYNAVNAEFGNLYSIALKYAP